MEEFEAKNNAAVVENAQGTQQFFGGEHYHNGGNQSQKITTSTNFIDSPPNLKNPEEISKITQRTIETRQKIAKSLKDLAIDYGILKEYRRAIDYFKQSLTIAEEIGDRNGVAESLHHLGIAYNNLGEYQWAINYFQKSLTIAEEIGDRNGVASSLDNLGNAYKSLGERISTDNRESSTVLRDYTRTRRSQY